jgi:TSCPD domain
MTRPKILQGTTYETKCGCGKVFVTCNNADGRLVELFVRLGKGGGCGSATSEAVGRLASMGMLRFDMPPEIVVRALSGIQCHKQPSCVDAVAGVVREHCGVSE